LQNNSTFNIGVLVSGRGTNLQAIINAIERGSLDAHVALVISNKENIHALERCRKHGIDNLFLDPKNFNSKETFESAIIEKFNEKLVNLVCLAGYMRILSKKFIGAFRGKIINIHPSLLPAFPGLSAQKQALDYGVKLTGCTVHFVDEGVDSGAVIAQTAVPVLEGDNEETLSQRILEQEHILYPQVIQWIIQNRVSLLGRNAIISPERNS
tara:strand:+ start:544 stop:1176 length:633 start_codon:yes stop_codon:yes gene_type:complete